jgi:hypothetical protein
MKSGGPTVVQAIFALFFLWVGLKLVEWFAPQWAKWYIIMIALSIIVVYHEKFVQVLNGLEAIANAGLGRPNPNTGTPGSVQGR